MIPLDGQHLWFGVVEDVFDPERQGRVRVRIIGAHTDDRSLLPTEDLPWADVLMPVTNASVSGVGGSPVGLVNGSVVAGIFKDGLDMQDPVVMFAAGGKRKVYQGDAYGFNDPDGVYPKKDTNQDHDVNVLARGDVKGSKPVGQAESGRVKDVQIDPESPKPDPNAPVSKDAPWMPIAIAERGINERDNPARVKEYHKVGNGVALSEDTPWCAGFCGWSLVQAGYKSSRSAMARSYLNYGAQVDRNNVPYGAIAVMRGTRGPSSGHVAFVVKDLGDKVQCIGGNQSTDGGKKFDDGGRVTMVNFKKDKVIEFRMPTANDKKK